MEFEFAPEVLSVAQFPHIEIAAKAIGLPKEKVAAMEIIKAALVYGMFGATEKADYKLLKDQLLKENQTFADILRACYVDLKHVGYIKRETLEMIYGMLAAFESVPSFNRNKAFSFFCDILAEKVFTVKEAVEGFVKKEEFMEAISDLKREIISLKERMEALKAVDTLKAHVR
ncbi:MAG: hypothetical protein DRO23_08840 [Thermoprotei archaeon]|nr:MAG: hypothetical protein DRO23_08840 [Thermoprotei archaeon]